MLATLPQLQLPIVAFAREHGRATIGETIRLTGTRRCDGVPLSALCGLGAVATTLAATTLYLARDELICDGERSLCIDGTRGYDTNPRLLWLRGRVNATAPPGMLRITLKGTNRLGHVRFAPMEIRLRGRATEIVDFRMIPDYPDVNDWQIDRIVFLADGDD